LLRISCFLASTLRFVASIIAASCASGSRGERERECVCVCVSEGGDGVPDDCTVRCVLGVCSEACQESQSTEWTEACLETTTREAEQGSRAR
jgi:hypothetical protein